MQWLVSLCLLALAVQLSVAPPVTQNKKENKENEIEDKEEGANFMEYQRYLQEVLEVLESDEGFKQKLHEADNHDLRTGKIADHLEFVNHNIRTKLDELKREELERLRHLARKEYNLQNGLEVDHLKIAEHLDHTNERTFEIQDLKNLIAKTAKDLAEADAKRREHFKRYEMQKEFEEQEKLKAMNEAEKLKYEEELKAIKEKHKNHERVHHPGSKQQLKEVWEELDHMESEDFNPRTFFYLHDIDGNGLWDQNEVKALFLKELDKLYARGATHEDMMKRTEEMERMREHVFNEADLNKDGFISYEEFLEETKRADFEQDEEWEGLDEQQIYTHEEYEAFERRKQEEIQKMIAKGMLPPHHGNIPAHPDSFPPQYANMPAQGVVPPVAMHQQQYQDQHHGQYIPQGQVPMHQQAYQNHVPMQVHDPSGQQQYHPQMPQQPNPQYHPGQVPVQQHQQYQGQVPVQHQEQQAQYQQAHPQQYQQAQQHQQAQQVQQAQQHQQAQQQVPQQSQPPQNQQQHPQAGQQQQHDQQNIVHPVPQAAVPNAVPQQPNQKQPQQPIQQNAQSAQVPPAQPAVQKNVIHTPGKV